MPYIFFLYVRETLLQAVGMIINVVGEKVKETVIDDLKQTLVGLLQASQVSIVQLWYRSIITSFFHA